MTGHIHGVTDFFLMFFVEQVDYALAIAAGIDSQDNTGNGRHQQVGQGGKNVSGDDRQLGGHAPRLLTQRLYLFLHLVIEAQYLQTRL